MPTGAKANIDLVARDYASRSVKGFTTKLDRLQAKLTRLSHWAMGSLFLQGGIFAGAIKSASDLEETTSKFDTVFKEQANSVKVWSDTVANEMGRSEEQMRRFMSEAQDLFVPLGFDPKAAADMSKTISKLAVDLASFNNQADQDVFRNLTSAMVGNSEAMKKYGVLVNQNTIKQWALNNSIDPKTMTEQQKVLARLNIVMDMTTAAQGDAIRTAGSFANMYKRFKSSTSDAAAALGQLFLPMATKAVAALARWAVSVRAYVRDNAQFVQAIFASVAAIGALLIVAPRLIGAISGISKALLFLMANPIVAVVAGISALVGYFVLAGTKGDSFGEKLINLGSKIKEFADSVISFLAPTFEWMMKAFLKVHNFVLPLWQLLVESMISAWAQLQQEIIPIVDLIHNTITSAWDKIAKYILPVVEFIRNSVKNAFLYMTFVIKNWKLAMHLALIAAGYYLVKFVNDIGHALTVVVPAYLKFFLLNWKEIFQTVYNGLKSFATNVWKNLKNLFTAIWNLFKGKKWNFQWTGLLDGFESTIKQMPIIAERAVGPVESALKNKLNDLSKTVESKWKEHKDSFDKKALAVKRGSMATDLIGGKDEDEDEKKAKPAAPSMPSIADLGGDSEGKSKTGRIENLKAVFKRIQAKASSGPTKAHLEEIANETKNRAKAAAAEAAAADRKRELANIEAKQQNKNLAKVVDGINELNMALPCAISSVGGLK